MIKTYMSKIVNYSKTKQKILTIWMPQHKLIICDTVENKKSLKLPKK